MTAYVDPKHLVGALSKILSVIERRSQVPVLSHVLLAAKDGHMSLRGTDTDLELSLTVPCEGDLAAICAPAEQLHASASRLVERGQTCLEHDDRTLTVSAGRARASMPVMSAGDMPSLSPGEAGSSLVVAGKDLAAIFAACAPAMNTDQSRPYLNGVRLERGFVDDPRGEGLCGVATNGHKLSARHMPSDPPADFPGIIVPAKAATALAKLAADWSEVEIEATDTKFQARTGMATFITKLVEGSYPDWRRVVPKKPPFASFDATSIRDAIATAVAPVKGAKNAPALRITFGDQEAEFSTRSIEVSTDSSDACAMSLLAEELPVAEIGVAPSYMLEMLAALDAETVEIACDGPESTIVLTAAALTDRRAIVMPMRI